jgi:opacity protein-like surface antigen
MKRILIACVTALSLAACATPPTVYQPAATAQDIGWRATKIEADRYRVSFRANPDLKRDQVEDKALRRAAEITLADGYQWFRVVSRNTEQVGGRDRGGTSVGVGGSTGSYGSGVGVGIGFDLSPDSRRYETVLEILLGRGAKPDGADAYDAQSVLTRTGG